MLIKKQEIHDRANNTGVRGVAKSFKAWIRPGKGQISEGVGVLVVPLAEGTRTAELDHEW